jgi:anti-sigma regulatory factor (Ser/Thr protein kinase)
MANHVLLVLSEAVNNAVIHGNQGDPRRQVRVCLRINDGKLTADITDEGRNGLERIKARRRPTAMSEHGRGVDLMTHYAGNIEFVETDDGGLRVTLRFDLNENLCRKTHS